jgi:hypothetical protein
MTLQSGRNQMAGGNHHANPDQYIDRKTPSSYASKTI